ncbi:hypothetical protein ACETRX_04050 [Labrys portucalensis]|uniref:Uncharacterized protein n=1 Tax=Labrys neptuniae TaxID=376174 RepID=A0ABV6Z9J1_9HYPH
MFAAVLLKPNSAESLSMVRPNTDQNLISPEIPMNSVAALSAISKRVVEREQLHSGANFDDALKSVAGRLRTGVGTFSNVIKRRVKTVSFELRDRIVAEALHTLQRDEKRIEHERQMVLQARGPDCGDLGRLEGALTTVREAMTSLRTPDDQSPTANR